MMANQSQNIGFFYDISPENGTIKSLANKHCVADSFDWESILSAYSPFITIIQYKLKMLNPEKPEKINNMVGHCSLNKVFSPSSTFISNLDQNQNMFFEKMEDEEQNHKGLRKVNPYKIVYQEYIGAKIKPLHRYKIFKWIQSQSQRQKYSREVLAYSCYYFDLFLSKTQPLSWTEFQEIALACMMVAVKIQGGFFPKLEKDFSLQKVLQLQAQICLKLNFFLYPKTYLKHLDDYLLAWNRLTMKLGTQYQGSKFQEQSEEGSIRIKSLYEKIQYIYMVSQSLKYELGQLCFNFFFIETMMNLRALQNDFVHFTGSIKNDGRYYQDWIRSIYHNFNTNSSIFNEFLRYQGNDIKFPALNLDIALYLIPFLTLQTDNKLNMFPYNRITQTYSPSALKGMDKLCKNMISNN